MQKREVVVLSGVRTAIGSYGGSLKNHKPTKLAGQMVSEAINRSGVSALDVGQVVFGNVIHSEPADMYMGRVAAIEAGLPENVPGLTVNRLCGSGLQAVLTAAQQIELGICDTVVAGGAESMSLAPYHLPTARFGQRMGNGEMIDPMVAALHCPFNHIHMGVTAENVADKFGVTREQQDELAATSHNRAQQAIENGYFTDQIIPIEVKSRKGLAWFDKDEHVRFDCTSDDVMV